MKKTTAPKTPSPHTKAAKPAADQPDFQINYRKDFFVAAANMSWQLAVVVLVPIIGGFELDQKFNTLPALTIVGFFLAMGGMAAVVVRQLNLVGPAFHNDRRLK